MKHALAPDLSSLDDRSVRAWTERMAVLQLEDGRYVVESQSDTTYIVDLTAGRCTCPDHSIRDERCKHLRRVAIEINEGRLPPPEKRARRCAVCAGTAFVKPAASPPLCRTCRIDAGELVWDRETGDLLRVATVTDQPAEDVLISDTGQTVAEYPTNAAYAPTDPVVEAFYPGAGSTKPACIYRYPISRLVPIRSDDRPDESAGRDASGPGARDSV
ncbi:MAG: SWIM zinc finger family protein [Halobacteriales archaeon]|nr:SWIM zinc finger family protein [Halobacteriales archaeon]